MVFLRLALQNIFLKEHVVISNKKTIFSALSEYFHFRKIKNRLFLIKQNIASRFLCVVKAVFINSTF